MSDEKSWDYIEGTAYVRYYGSVNGLASFNSSYGYLEAILRGFKTGMLKENEYRQLSQCESLDDVKLALSETDYGLSLQNIQKITPDAIYEAAMNKFVEEFDFVRNQAIGPLATFLDFITYQYMIENVSMIVSSLIKQQSPEDLLHKCHPLGKFPRMKSILTFENSEDGLVELYRTVLIDTPVAPYFETYFNAEIQSDEPIHEMQKQYKEVEIEIITNMLQKLWLEDFYRYCETLEGETAEVMKELLEFEADRRALTIVLTSFKTALNEPSARDTERKALFCSFGQFYPDGHKKFSDVNEMAKLELVLDQYPLYSKLWKTAQQEGKDFEDMLALHQLKEQEMQNLNWIIEVIYGKFKDQKTQNRYIKIF